jgi:hypothetical protein
MKKILAMTLSLLLLVALFAACGDKKPEETTTKVTGETTTEEQTLDVDATEATTEAPEETTEDTTTDLDATTDPDATAGAEATTVAVTTTATPKKPGTKAEILTYFNTIANRVKTEKPGFVWKDRTIIDDKKISSPNAFINTISPPIINMAKGVWSNWSDDRVVKKGDNHDGDFPVGGQSWSSRLKPEWVKSATCTESGNTYHIHIVLNDERVPELPEDPLTTIHGQVIKAFAKGEIADGASSVGVNIEKFDALYSGSYIDCTVDKNTGNFKSATYYVSCIATLKAKLGFTVEATLPLAQEKVYTF